MPNNPKYIEIIIGKQIKEIRVKKGMSQETLSLETGLDRSYISMVERGKRNPTLVVIFRMCAVLNTPPYELIKNIEKEYENS